MNAKLMNQDQVETMLNHKAPEAMGEAMLDQHTFRQGMANLGAAVNVITTDGGAGQAGFTASAVCSVTDTPPTLLVCLNRSASVFETFKKQSSVMCKHVVESATTFI